ncbi:MAG: hypothetical protein EA423_12730 [Phycisphaerales bacterium]|nr:MAG: hypothetical protein EA423_12730 [Phycisphaerales bacterium]
MLGADRKSGEPRKMLIEAKSPEAARSLAESRGMLISVVETRSSDGPEATTREPVKAAVAGDSSPRPIPRPRPAASIEEPSAPPEPEPDSPPREWTDDRIGENRREGLRTVFRLSSKTPEIEPLEGEELIEVFDPSFRELGILRSWLGRSRRMVVTSRRVVVIERRRGLDNIREALHENSDGVVAVRGVRWLLLVPGVLLLTQPLFFGFGGLVGIGLIAQLVELTVGQAASTQAARDAAVYTVIGLSVAMLLFAMLLVFSAFERRIGLRTQSGFVGVRVRRIGPSETSALVGAMVSAREKQRENAS